MPGLIGWKSPTRHLNYGSFYAWDWAMNAAKMNW